MAENLAKKIGKFILHFNNYIVLVMQTSHFIGYQLEVTIIECSTFITTKMIC